jgi:hypothetical protein
MCTSDESKVKLDNVIGLFVKVEQIGPNIGILSCFVEVFFNHIEELISLTTS